MFDWFSDLKTNSQQPRMGGRRDNHQPDLLKILKFLTKGLQELMQPIEWDDSEAWKYVGKVKNYRLGLQPTTWNSGQAAVG